MSAPIPLPPALLNHLRGRLSTPGRHYHTVAHVEALLGHLAAFRHLAQAPWQIEAAIWYHDIVHDPTQSDNELCSADVARFELMSIGWLGVDVERVASMVEATRDHRAPPGDGDTQLLLDLDLSVLASGEASYDRYAAQIRAEYAHVPEAGFRAGRARVLRALLGRDALYRTAALQALWEAPARANLQRELAALT